MYNSTNPLIYIVDENQVYASMVQGYLKSHHYANSRIFTSVEKAITEAEEHPDIVICENLYNNLAGLDFMRRFKQSSIDSTFIFLSSFENVEAVVGVMRNGAYDYIVKGKDSLKKLIKSLRQFKHTINDTQIRKHETSTIYMVLIAIAVLVGLILILTQVFPDTFKL